ncbi:hypothetical protein [Bacillus pseudomycoides]|uniref:hypothetical protein n=1 Tax=Bacillus pseudomycoides TaxID=64104 RepID=UPI000BEB6AC7|nr:hypothetical protein [Bacillus pseudomycoides]PEB42206.1 hypothetical protein COO06_07800 [Bacillus pseudomycoides]
MWKKINKILGVFIDNLWIIWITVLALCVCVYLVISFLGDIDKSKLGESILKSIDGFQTIEYRVVDYSKKDASGSVFSSNGTMDLIIKDEQETYNFEIEYLDKDGNLKVISQEQSIIVKYDESIQEPKLIMKKIPDKVRKGKYATVSEYVNPTLYIPLNK